MDQDSVSTSYTDYHRLSWGLVKPPDSFPQSLVAFLPVTLMFAIITLATAYYTDTHQHQLETGLVAALILLLGLAFILAANIVRYRIVQSLGTKLIMCSITTLGIKTSSRHNIPWDQVDREAALNNVNLPATADNTLIIPLKHGRLQLRFQNPKIRTQIINSVTHYLNQSTQPSA